MCDSYAITYEVELLKLRAFEIVGTYSGFRLSGFPSLVCNRLAHTHFSLFFLSIT